MFFHKNTKELDSLSLMSDLSALCHAVGGLTCREKSTIQFYATILLFLSFHTGTAPVCPGIGVCCCAYTYTYTYPYSQGNSLHTAPVQPVNLSDFTCLSPRSPTEGTTIFVHCLTYILNFNSQRKSKWRLVF